MNSVATLRGTRSGGIKALNSKLSEYARQAASGETILVTDRDRVVAEPGPLRGTRSPILTDAFLGDAVRSGVLTPAPLGSRPDKILAELDKSRRDR